METSLKQFMHTVVATCFLAAAMTAAHAGEAKLNVFAAASLKTALDKVNAACASDVGEAATISYAATPALARQIEQGAPADVFFSADTDWMTALAEKELIKTGTAKPLLGNEIVLIVSSESGATAQIEPAFDLAGLLDGGRLAMANVDAVPAGKYGKAALEALGVWDAVKDQIAQAENVRAALALVATGEAAAGIVYATDARAEAKVRVVGTFPAASHPPIVYPVAEVATSENGRVAAFLACLASPKAADIFQSEGFAVLPD